MIQRQSINTRAVRRTLVIAVAALWALFVAPYPQSLDGAGLPLTLVLTTLDLVLAELTGWLAFRRTPSIDEWQSGIRDRAYRMGFRLILLGLLLMVVAVFVGSVMASLSLTASTSQPIPQTPVVFGGRWIVGLLELILFVPTGVIAWLQPESLDSESTSDRRLASRRWLPLLVVPSVAALWIVAISAMPVRASAVKNNADVGGMQGASCGHFAATREVGYGFGAQLAIDVRTCWDGTHAFSYPGERPEYLSRCSALPGTVDFARIKNLKCSERTDANGTLHYSMRANVYPGLGGAGSRELTLELAVSKEGRASTAP